ncbi:MAG: hypothetical protein AAF810_23755 [Cyanobacteria bacterium P01_D01_bin.36]
MPEQLSHTGEIACLSPAEQLKLNQIRGNSYLHLFGLVEEFILPLVVDHAKTVSNSDIEAPSLSGLCSGRKQAYPFISPVW